MRPTLFRNPLRHARLGVAPLCVAAAIFFAWPARRTEVLEPNAGTTPRAPAAARAEEIDSRLRTAAAAALAGREGAIVLMDAQTGRIRAAANLELAGGAALPPGSAVKPFTLLAALRARLVEPGARLACREHFARPGVEFTCAHPVFRPAFDAEQALAHSCNYYFARLGERVEADDFNATLSAFGFGPHEATARRRTRATAEGRPPQTTSPRLPRAPLRVETALGEGDALLVTPLQLLAAYAALANGGGLFEPREAAPAGFDARLRSRVTVSAEERALLVAGMRGAVKYGTAEAAGLDELPMRVFGKTGTATELGGFRTDGWFVGFASDAGGGTAAASTDAHADQPAPAEVKLAILVFLKRSQGRRAATLARQVLAEYARLTAEGEAQRADPRVAARNSFSTANDAPGFSPSPPSPTPPRDSDVKIVRVRTSRDSVPLALALEEYLFGALAAEASTEDEFAALKAQAIVSRTYAVRHAGRHAREGFDFCATTHCQRYLRVTAANSRADFHALLRRALSDTAGETLRDARGRTASAYFSASCGGMTADVETLWGTPARDPYERGVRDEACAGEPHARWADAIPARRLLLALREDARSDVGSRLDHITVLKRDRTGRAQLVAVSGERRRVLRGWDFKIIVGRTLGWSLVKSSRFRVERAGDRFVFRGSGFGHGLGLCQRGAHVLARRGASHLQILAHYFPGTTVSRDDAAGDQTTSTRAADAAWHADAAAPLDEATREPQARTDARLATLSSNFFALSLSSRPRFKTVGAGLVPARSLSQPHGQGQALPLHTSLTAAATARAGSPRLTLASANFRVQYPAREAGARREVEAALRTLEAARADLLRRLSAASLAPPALPSIEVVAHETTADFVASTGQPPWVAAAARGHRVELQPLATLRRRRITAQTLRHEFAHVVLSALSRNRAPRWLAEGLAAHFAGEGPLLSRHAPPKAIPLEELEGRLARPASAEDARALYGAAYREVAALVRAGGEAAVWRRAARS